MNQQQYQRIVDELKRGVTSENDHRTYQETIDALKRVSTLQDECITLLRKLVAQKDDELKMVRDELALWGTILATKKFDSKKSFVMPDDTRDRTATE